MAYILIMLLSLTLGFLIGYIKGVKEKTVSIKGYADSDKLDEAIKYYQELAKERYLNTGFNERVANWLKELRDRRKEE